MRIRPLGSFVGVAVAVTWATACMAGTPVNKPEESVMETPKRRAPAPVRPVTGGGIRYETVSGARARGFPQDGGVIAAVDTATGKELWTLVVYQTPIDPHEETDVQEVYITRLA